MTTAYVTDESFVDHNFPRHPEHAGRIEAIWNQLDTAGITDRLLCLHPTPVSDQQILAVHSLEHLHRLEGISRQDRMVLIDQDTYALPSSLVIARRAAGAVVSAIDAVMTGTADNAMAVVRPPGHHATPDRQMGFCLLNNIAIGARHALDQHQLNRIMIVDYDVHHGNGTQDIFYTDSSVMFLSIHQSPHYPGTGHLEEIGSGPGHGFTLNVPLAAGHGNDSYQALFEQVVAPAATRFAPELLLISAGFDAHWMDPLAGMRLSLSGYDWLARESLKLAENLCGGRIVFVMEGGYDLKALAHGWSNIARALMGADELSDPYGNAAQASAPADVQSLIDSICRLHNI